MKYRETIVSNCANKIFLGNADNRELDWWETEFGQKRTWIWGNSMDMNKLQYDAKISGVKYGWELNWPVNKLGTMVFKAAAIKLKNDSGGFNVNEGRLNFVSARYKEAQPMKTYDFTKFTAGVVDETADEKHKEKFDPKHINFTDGNNEIDPIQTDTTDSEFKFDNENAIVVNLKKNKQ